MRGAFNDDISCPRKCPASKDNIAVAAVDTKNTAESSKTVAADSAKVSDAESTKISAADSSKLTTDTKTPISGTSKQGKFFCLLFVRHMHVLLIFELFLLLTSGAYSKYIERSNNKTLFNS